MGIGMHKVNVVTLAGIFACLSGCGGGSPKPDGMPELHRITLKITQGGAPLADASVQLVPLDATASRWVSGGSTDESGDVQIKTLGEFSGAPAGKYKVTITKSISEGDAGDPNDPGATSTQKLFHVVDLKFRAVDTTPAEIEVAAGSNSPDPIDVGASIKEEDQAL